MSQMKLGDALGLTFQQVQKYENGKNRISAATLYKVASILQTPVSFFFQGLPPIITACAGCTWTMIRRPTEEGRGFALKCMKCGDHTNVDGYRI